MRRPGESTRLGALLIRTELVLAVGALFVATAACGGAADDSAESGAAASDSSARAGADGSTDGSTSDGGEDPASSTGDDPAAESDDTDGSPAVGISPAPGGAGELVDATEEFGIDGALVGIRGHAVAVADVDGDGWQDLFVGTFADRPVETYEERGADGPAPDRLLLGSPTGFTVDESFEGRLGRTAGAAFADLDLDGDPDLIVSRNPRDEERSAAPSEIYRNDGGTLTPVGVLDDQPGGRAVGIVDFDGDGLDDIVLVKDRWSGPGTTLYRNDGDLEFTDVTSDLGFPADVFGLGVGIGDLDGDGIDDLVVGGSNRWFLGDGTGFTEGQTSPLPWELSGNEDDPAHVILADTNDDGALDVFIGQHFNSTVDDDRPEPVRLYLNEGGAPGAPTFVDVTDEVGLPSLATKSPKILLLDLDGSSLPDLITSASYPTGGDGRQPVVASGGDVVDGLPTFTSDDPEADAHYWIDGVVFDANGDGRSDVFLVEWEPALSARLFLNLPLDR